MNFIDRPNKDALTRAIDIFRDVMRPFLIRCLIQAPGISAEEAVRQSLQHEQQIADFERMMRKRGDLELALDVNHFPQLVEKYWQDVFSAEFRGDSAIVGRLRFIRKVRNEVSHPPPWDLDAKYTGACLSQIVYVLDIGSMPWRA